MTNRSSPQLSYVMDPRFNGGPTWALLSDVANILHDTAIEHLSLDNIQRGDAFDFTRCSHDNPGHVCYATRLDSLDVVNRARQKEGMSIIKLDDPIFDLKRCQSDGEGGTLDHHHDASCFQLASVLPPALLGHCEHSTIHEKNVEEWVTQVFSTPGTLLGCPKCRRHYSVAYHGIWDTSNGRDHGMSIYMRRLEHLSSTLTSHPAYVMSAGHEDIPMPKNALQFIWLLRNEVSANNNHDVDDEFWLMQYKSIFADGQFGDPKNVWKCLLALALTQRPQIRLNNIQHDIDQQEHQQTRLTYLFGEDYDGDAQSKLSSLQNANETASQIYDGVGSVRVQSARADFALYLEAASKIKDAYEKDFLQKPIPKMSDPNAVTSRTPEETRRFLKESVLYAFYKRYAPNEDGSQSEDVYRSTIDDMAAKESNFAREAALAHMMEALAVLFSLSPSFSTLTAYLWPMPKDVITSTDYRDTPKWIIQQEFAWHRRHGNVRTLMHSMDMFFKHNHITNGTDGEFPFREWQALHESFVNNQHIVRKTSPSFFSSLFGRSDDAGQNYDPFGDISHDWIARYCDARLAMMNTLIR